jgi:hypothetical protein
MGITLERFQAVVLDSRLDLDKQIYSKSLESTTKNPWQSFLNWLNNLVRNDGKDQFEMLVVSKNIEDFVQTITPEFYDTINLEEVQTGIENLQALQAKFKKNSQKGEIAAKNLDLPIHTLKEILKKKTIAFQEVARQNEILKENLKITNFFSTTEIDAVFKENFRRLSSSYKNCLECFGLDTLKEVYNQYVVNNGVTDPKILLNFAEFRKERLMQHNEATLKEIKTYFNSSDEVLTLFFPEFKENLPELRKKFKEGHLFLDIQPMNELNAVIKKPESVKKQLEQTQHDLFPALANQPRELEERRILSGLLNLRNEKVFGESEELPSRKTPDQPALARSQPAPTKIEPAPIKIEEQPPLNPNTDTMEEIATKASEVVDALAAEASSALSFLNNFGKSLLDRI